MIANDRFEQVEAKSIEELHNWLNKNYSRKEGVWLVTFKKSEASKYVSRWDVLDELICYGWIDGICRKLDDKRTMQLITPRRVEHWAKTYKDRVTILLEENRMHKSGLKSIEASKENGLWNFMDDVDQLIVPQDLKDELTKHKGAEEFFNAISDSSKRFALRWIKLAKTDTTRKNRILKIAQLSKKGEKLAGS